MVNIYQSLLNLISSQIFGGVVPSGSPQELISILLSSFGSIFCFAIPFYVVFVFFKFMTKLIFSWFN